MVDMHESIVEESPYTSSNNNIRRSLAGGYGGINQSLASSAHQLLSPTSQKSDDEGVMFSPENRPTGLYDELEDDDINGRKVSRVDSFLS